jgi:acetyl/propionyl-CoA carboxylase alpha subunit
MHCTGALHVRMADEAVCIGPSAALQSYLNVSKVMAAIKQTGAQGVHPGYGFLSENMQFAKECEEANVAFIGPPASAIESMGDKVSSMIVLSCIGRANLK